MTSIAFSNREAQVGSPSDTVARPWRTLVTFTVLIWTLNFAVVSLGNWLDALPDLPVRVGARAVTSLVGFAICFVIAALLTRLEHWSIRTRALLLFVLSAVSGEALVWASAFGRRLFGGEEIATTPGTIVFNLAFWTWLVLAWGALFLAISYAYEIREREQRWAAATTLAQRAQLRALRYQIRPHFLFNSLNSVVSLILENRSGQAVDMVRGLSGFLRKSLELDPVEDLRLADELELQQLYLKIERIRFPDLEVEINLEPAVADVLVPSLILQPVVENAVKYSVGRNLEPARIVITGRRIGQELELLVEDSGCKSDDPVPSLGLGLANVKERLKSRFGDHHALEIGPSGDKGFRVRIVVPARERA